MQKGLDGPPCAKGRPYGELGPAAQASTAHTHLQDVGRAVQGRLGALNPAVRRNNLGQHLAQGVAPRPAVAAAADSQKLRQQRQQLLGAHP